jgi:hypothetical protein
VHPRRRRHFFRGSYDEWLVSLPEPASLAAWARPRITENLQARHFILPMAIFIPTVMGMLYQQSNAGGATPAPEKK